MEGLGEGLWRGCGGDGGGEGLGLGVERGGEGWSREQGAGLGHGARVDREGERGVSKQQEDAINLLCSRLTLLVAQRPSHHSPIAITSLSLSLSSYASHYPSSPSPLLLFLLLSPPRLPFSFFLSPLMSSVFPSHISSSYPSFHPLHCCLPIFLISASLPIQVCLPSTSWSHHLPHLTHFHRPCLNAFPFPPIITLFLPITLFYRGYYLGVNSNRRLASRKRMNISHDFFYFFFLPLPFLFHIYLINKTADF